MSHLSSEAITDVLADSPEKQQDSNLIQRQASLWPHPHYRAGYCSGYCCHSQDQRNKHRSANSTIPHQDMPLMNEETLAPTRPKSENITASNKLVQKKEISKSFSYLEELAIIEEQTKEKERKSVIQEYLQIEENSKLWRNFHHITLNQCLSKPWVSSYFRNIPLRIYCLPLGNRPQVKKKKRKC